MDIRLLDADPTAEERQAVDAVLGPPASAWDGGERGSARDTHSARGGHEQRRRRTLLLPALQALQGRVGWVSEGGLNHVCERLGLPPAEAWSVATFYALLATEPRPRRVVHVCDDIACLARGAGELGARIEARCGAALGHPHEGEEVRQDPDRPAWMRSPCLGLCDHAPAALLTEAGERPREALMGALDEVMVQALLEGASPPPDAAGQAPLPQAGQPGLVLLRRIGTVDPTSLDAYRAAGGYAMLAKALAMGPEAVIAEVAAAKLVGRGGAAFPTHRKWDAVRVQPAQPHYLICNADESEPGTFKDRVLMCGDPFAVVESMTIAALAAGCQQGYVYLRAEYPLAHERLAGAIAQARAAGLLGADVLGSGFGFDIELRRGSGAYICGEETALFESIEGRRGEPRTKPPFPVEVGLFGKPTVVNNVETLVNVLPILERGGAAYAEVGTPQSSGTRLFCLSGNVARPGVYEVPMGTRLSDLLALAGGVAEGRPLKAVLMGGAAGSFLRPDQVGMPLTLEDARAAGTTLGSGVVMAFDDHADLARVLRRIATFFRDESCGQCVPCRVGTVRQEEALDRIHAGCGGAAGRAADLRLLDEVGAGMRDASICGLGQAAYAAVESGIKVLGLYGEPPPPVEVPPARTAPPAAQAAEGLVGLTIDGQAVAAAPGSTVLQACRGLGIDVPTLCYAETLSPASACRLCVVELEGGRVLAPSCSRAVEPGMVVHTDSPRVRHSRKMVLELLDSSVDLSLSPSLQGLLVDYGCDAARYGEGQANPGRDHAAPGHHAPVAPGRAATVHQPIKIDNDLYIRDYSKCVLCYKCVEACGEDHQNTFAIAVAGRGFEARISTELAVPLGDSACVYCGNCIAVCPTGALMVKTEFDLRAAGEWAEDRQTATDTICPYCGVGCTLRLHEQDGRLVKAMSPFENPITQGNLCIKGRFGWRFVQPLPLEPADPTQEPSHG